MEQVQDEIVQYLIINSDLTMSSGKVGAQTAHAERRVTHNIMKMAAPYYCDIAKLEDMPKVVQNYIEWSNGEEKKITLKASEKELRELLAKYGDQIVHVIDNGHTEIPPNSLTVVALNPMKKSEARDYYINKRWRLY